MAVTPFGTEMGSQIRIRVRILRWKLTFIWIVETTISMKQKGVEKYTIEYRLMKVKTKLTIFFPLFSVHIANYFHISSYRHQHRPLLFPSKTNPLQSSSITHFPSKLAALFRLALLDDSIPPNILLLLAHAHPYNELHHGVLLHSNTKQESAWEDVSGIAILSIVRCAS